MGTLYGSARSAELDRQVLERRLRDLGDSPEKYRRVFGDQWREAMAQTARLARLSTQADAAILGGAFVRPSWGSWGILPKVTRGGMEYAVIRGQLYTQHAVEHMMPRSFGTAAGTGVVARGIPPMAIEEVITHGRIASIRVVGSTTRVSKILGDIEVVLENGIVISVIRH